MQYASEKQMGPMKVQNCHLEEKDTVVSIFLKGVERDEHEKGKGEHKGHGKRAHLKMKIDARDGHVISTKDKDDDDDKDEDEHHDKDEKHKDKHGKD